MASFIVTNEVKPALVCPPCEGLYLTGSLFVDYYNYRFKKLEFFENIY